MVVGDGTALLLQTGTRRAPGDGDSSLNGTEPKPPNRIWKATLATPKATVKRNCTGAAMKNVPSALETENARNERARETMPPENGRPARRSGTRRTAAPPPETPPVAPFLAANLQPVRRFRR